MKAFCLRANEIDGTSTEGAIVAYYCAWLCCACPLLQRPGRWLVSLFSLSFLASTAAGAPANAGRCYGMQKVMAKGGLAQTDKMELLPFMDYLEKVSGSAAPAALKPVAVLPRIGR